MSDNAHIEWTDATWNIVTGCTLISEGCRHCYAARSATSRAKRPAEIDGRTILFPRCLIDRLGPHAAKRGVHPNRLARMLVEVAVDDDLIDSIMDDARLVVGRSGREGCSDRRDADEQSGEPVTYRQAGRNGNPPRHQG